MRQLVTAGRIRALISGLMTDADVIDTLRRHRIRYGYTTEGGALHIMIPSIHGPIRIYKGDGRPPLPYRTPVYHGED